MSKHFYIFVLLILFYPFLLVSQKYDLFFPKEIKQAYTKNSRSESGKPGSNYWQNHASYKIEATLDPSQRTITGSEVIVYTNNSPDTLKELIFNIYQDIYKKGTARDWDIGSIDLHNGVEIKSLKINGEIIHPNDNRVNRYATIMSVFLLDFIPPRSSIQVEIEWQLTLPAQRTIRMGTYENENFMVAFWFPRIAVYDDIVGWNRVPYVGNCEFYNDFSDFEVNITLPEKYLAWSSAKLQNPEEIYSEKVLKEIEEASKSDKVVHIIKKGDWQSKTLFKNVGPNIWKFKLQNSVDFAFAVTNSYLWDATSVPSGNRRVFINAVYKPESKDFHQVAEITHQIIDFYTNKTPGIVFPFEQMTAFNGRGGMEYPGMVNDGDSRDLNATIYLTAHEVGHSYFPFNTGLNEQKYAWMDEGLISFFPRKTVKAFTKDTDYKLFADLIETYNQQAGSYLEIPLILPSTNTGLAYRYQAYNKSSVAFIELEKYLGTDTFNLALQVFTENWKGKHPTPYDFFFTFNQVAAEDLSWFWKPWFFEMTYADLSIDRVDANTCKIENKGGNPVDINLEVYFTDGTKEVMHLKSAIWKSALKQVNLNFGNKEIQSLKLDTVFTPDAYPSDNQWKITE